MISKEKKQIIFLYISMVVFFFAIYNTSTDSSMMVRLLPPFFCLVESIDVISWMWTLVHSYQVPCSVIHISEFLPCPVKERFKVSYIDILTPLIFHTSVSWGFFTRVTVSFLKSPGLFSVFWPILVMLLSGWSLLILWFLSLVVPLSNHSGIVPSAPIAIGITVTFMFHSLFVFSSLARCWKLSLFSVYSNFTLWSAGTA